MHVPKHSSSRVFVDEAFITSVVSGGTDGIEATLTSEREVLPEGARMTYVLQGIKAAASKWATRAKAEQRAVEAGSRQKAPRVAVTSEALDYALTQLWISCELEYKETVRSLLTAARSVIAAGYS